MSIPDQSGEDADHSVRAVSSSSRQNGGKRSLFGKSVGGIAVLALVGLYAVAQPLINDRLGWNLPELRRGTDGQMRVVESKPESKTSAPSTSQPSADKTGEKTFSPASSNTATASKNAVPPKVEAPESVSPSSKSADAKPGMSQMSKGPLADRMRPSGSSTPGTSNSNPVRERRPGGAQAVDDDLLHGLLREIGSKRYISPAGLLYTPGSAEGHRLEHLRRHTEDQTTRPGSHGVFDGGMAGALKTIDLAYQRAKKGERTTKQIDDGRTIYTVDMGGRVGFIGGSEGGRRRNPMARRVRLVLEDNRVITAYPM